jgi:hypothetical protein
MHTARKLAAPLGFLAATIVTATLLGSIDWSSFTDALTGVVPDVLALAAALVVGAMTIAVVFKGARAAIAWGVRYIH